MYEELIAQASHSQGTSFIRARERSLTSIVCHAQSFFEVAKRKTEADESSHMPGWNLWMP